MERLASEFREREPRLHMLILNAGAFHPGPYCKTADGVEQTLQVAYYAQVPLGVWGGIGEGTMCVFGSMSKSQCKR